MQKKYFGDVTDFYKFFFLKNIVGEYSLGINWCLTKNDKSNDGKNKVRNKPELKKFDNELYDIMLKRNLCKIQSEYFTKNTKFYGEKHEKFHMEYLYEISAFYELRNQDIIFFDPDTGIEMPSKKLSERYKYISYRILSKYWNENKTLIIFQHKDHQIKTLEDKKGKIIECLKCNKNDILMVNSKKVNYICVINKKHTELKNSIREFCEKYIKLGYDII